MTNETVQEVRRTVALVQADETAELTVPLTITLPGEVEQFKEPEITVAEVEAKALEGEVFVKIVLQQDTYYVVKETALVEKASTIHSFSRMLAVAESQPGLEVQMEADVNFVGSWQAEPLSSAERPMTKLRGECLIKLNYSISKSEVLITTKAPAAALTEDTRKSTAVETIRAHFKHDLDLTLPVSLSETAQGKISAEADFINEKATSMCGWIKVEGDVVASVFYQRPDGKMQKELFVFPLKQYFEHDEAKTGLEVVVVGEAEILYCVAEKDNKVVLRGLLCLKGTLKAIEKFDSSARSLEGDLFLTDHHFQPLHQSHHKFKLEEVVGTGSSQTLIEAEIFFKRPVKFVREPVAARVRHLQYEIIHNKVIVRGILHKELFAVEAHSGTVFVHEVNEKFVHFVDVPGAAPGMRAHVDARVEYVRVRVNSDGVTAQQAAIIEIRVKVVSFFKKDPLPPSKPWPKPDHPQPVKPVKPPRIYIVRSGDSVWKIANMFGVSMEAIIAANNLKNPDLIYPGQKLIIPY